ncbi:hypothetical protein [Thiolapillus brandeum]|uniref:Glycosyltransferase RgtA/B/C/D-like domain-containing protein n=1 Tax=Thiolapillus brandeum TaxID=1076588 RepID=A0A7U6GG80_9GAMM|nr:hypothetical protein [Thiolapillus brandeum]BAO43055.1 hypothetical protein TBH_C0107 [Thiolapillus brandeum]
MSGRQKLPVYAAAALASLLLSLWQIMGVQQINHDAVYYLEAIQGNADAIAQIGNWLFYSRLIEWTALLTGLAPEHAAWVVNTLLDTLTVLAFLRLVEELGGSPRALLWAALVVLSLPYFNDNRSEIIRDHGYWAFSLVAMIFYLRLFREFAWKNVLGWNLAMFTALLFRVEAVVFLAIMPLGLLTSGPGGRQKAAKTLLPVLIPGLGLALFSDMHNRLTDNMRDIQQVILVFTETIPHKATLMRKGVIPEFSQSMAETTLYLGVAWSIIKDLISSMSWLYFGILLLRRFFPAPGLPADYRRILWFYGLISAAILFTHGARHFVMVSRYTMALALMLLPVVVFALEELHRKYREENRAGPWLTAALLGMLVLLGDSLHGSSIPKAYILQAADWARNNIPDKSHIVTDYHRERVSWYSNRNSNKQLDFQRFKPGKTWLKDFDYAFVRSGKNMGDSRLYQVLSRRGLMPIKRIQPEQGRGVFIYRLKPVRTRPGGFSEPASAKGP